MRGLSSLIAIAAAFAAAILSFAPAAAQQEKGVNAAQIDKNGVLILVRGTMLALDQANKTGNYTVFRDLGGPSLQKSTAAQIGDGFAWQRKGNLDLSGVAVLEPQLTLLPQIHQNGMMELAGFFPSVPTQIKFELFYEPVNGQWRLSGISMSLGSSAPVAPAPPAPTKPAPKGKP
jgi:hypothetical protein